MMMEEEDSNDFYPIILIAPQSDSCNSMDLDELLPIERQMLNSTSSMLSKTSREVSFSGKDTVTFVESSEDWTDEERDNAWFTPEELDHIKRRAIKLCKNEALGKSISSKDSTRGMEIYFPARKKAHANFVYHVLVAYHETHVGNPDKVANLAEKWSLANKTNAHTIAVRDMYEAYFPYMMEQQPKKSSSCTPSLSPIRESGRGAVSVNPRDFTGRH